MLYYLASIILIVTGAEPGKLKAEKHDDKTGFNLVLAFLIEYWWVIAAALVLATFVGLGIWLMQRSEDPIEKDIEDLEPVLYLSGRNVKTPRSNIFEFRQSERVSLDPVMNEPPKYDSFSTPKPRSYMTTKEEPRPKKLMFPPPENYEEPKQIEHISTSNIKTVRFECREKHEAPLFENSTTTDKQMPLYNPEIYKATPFAKYHLK